MPKQGLAYTCPPEKFGIPPNLMALEGYAQHIIASMHTDYRNRMNGASQRTHVKKKKKAKLGGK